MKKAISFLLAAAIIHSATLVVRCEAQLTTTSVAGPTSLSAGGNSFGPIFSGDGRRIAFVSHAENLVTKQTLQESLQIFVHDLVTSNTVLVSASTNGRGGNANSFGPTISSNGQFVVFASEAGDLVSNDTNGLSDVFVRDLTSQTTALVSADASGQAPAFEASRNPLISADGRWVYFEGGAAILSGQPDFTSVYVYRRDLQSNTTTLVSKNPFSTNATSALWSITPDGRHAAFSSATNIPGGINRQTEVFVRDMESNASVWASSSLTNYNFSYRCVSAALSGDGQIVAFIVVPSVGSPALYRRNLNEAAPLLIASNVLERSTPQISSDGRYIVYETGTNVFRWDIDNQTNELVNLATSGGAPASGIARNPVVAPDGRRIVFISNSPDLTANGSTLFQIYLRDMVAGTTRLITVATNGQPSATNSEISFLAIAGDFSKVAFDSTAADLVEGDGNRASDVFVRELATETTSLISRREPLRPRTSGLGHAVIWNDCVSADGRFVTFTGYDNDLLPDDVNARPDVFVRDMLTGTIVTTGFSTNAARSPAISGNGRYVVYLRRNPIYAFETSGGAIWRFDRETGINELVAASSQRDPAISSNGNLVAFISGDNLVIRDMAYATNQTILAAPATRNRQAFFTPDGRFVLFNSTVTGTPGLYAWDNVLQQTQLVSYTYSDSSFALSANSRFVAFASPQQLLVRDLIAGTDQFLRFGTFSQPAMSALNGDGTLLVFSDTPRRLLALNTVTGEESTVADTTDLLDAPAISPDGRFVVYRRRLQTGTSTVRLVWQLYVRDRTLDTTTLISSNPDGTVVNAQVSRPVLAADGRTVIFHSVASDLVMGDYNDKSDVFQLTLRGADTDGDGMDDDWEVAYFGNLTRDGRGDFDGDGASDRAEFLAGTDPTDNGSIFRVLALTPAGGGSTQLIWSGNPDRTYRVEFKDDLGAANWTAVNGTISWNGSTASITDSGAAASAHRYYRVVRLP